MLNLKNMKMKAKLTLLFLVAGIIPLLAIGFFSIRLANEALMKSSFNQLEAIQEIKKSHIHSFFFERKGDINVFSANQTVMAAQVQFEAAFKKGGLTGKEWKTAHDKYHGGFKHFLDEYGYYDIFLISADGSIVYTVAKEGDLGQNLNQGAIAKTNLAEVFRACRDKQSVQLADFKWYELSNEPAAFIAGPLKTTGGKFQGVLAFQLSLKAINTIMQERDGLGKTGETYLVGADNLMRSDSFLDPKNHSVKASFSHPDKGSVDTEGSREALKGQDSKKIIIDYNGNPVLSAYGPVKISDNITWALLAEIDLAEVREPINNLLISMLIMGAILIVLVILLANFIAGIISRSINKVADVVNQLAQGNLNLKVEVDSKDEIGNMQEELGKTVHNLSQLIGVIKQSANNIFSGSEQIAQASQQQAQGANEQASATEEISSAMTQVSSSIQEVTASIDQIAAQTKQAAENTHDVERVSNESLQNAILGAQRMDGMVKTMNDISESSKSISKIMKTIDEIAFQTNLLALNAAVEAARAGRHGKGFAVVAEEVNNLSKRSSQAAKETANIIENSINKIEEGKKIALSTQEAFQNILGTVQNVTKLTGEITAMSGEQVKGIEQIQTGVIQVERGVQQVEKGIDQINQVNQQNASTAEENAASSEELSAQAKLLMELVDKFKLNELVMQDGNNDQMSGNKVLLKGRSGTNGNHDRRSPASHEHGGKAIVIPVKKKSLIQPEDVIALNEPEKVDFKEFRGF